MNTYKTARKETLREIAAKMYKSDIKISLTTKIRGLKTYSIKKWTNRGSYNDLKGRGRRIKLTTKVKGMIKGFCKDKITTDGASTRRTAAKLRKKGIPISHSTVHRYIAKQSWGKSYTVPYLMNLDDRHIEQRKTFCEKLLSNSFIEGEKYKRILFTDASTILLYMKPNPRIVRMWTSSRSNAINKTISKVKFNQGLKFCAGIMFNGRTELLKYKGKYNSAQYCQKVIQNFQTLNYDYLMQDNDRAHIPLIHDPN